MLVSWTKKGSNGTCPWGPSLAEYISLTETENSFGAFKILSKANRDDLKKECCFHVERLLEEIERRFLPSELHRCLSFLFDPMMIEENRPLLNDATYGRHELQYLRQKYEKLSDFDSKNVQMEWESFKPLIVNFIEIKSNNDSPMRHCTGIAKAAAINAISGSTGVTATVGSTTVAGTASTSATAIASGDITINGVNLGALSASTSGAQRGAQVAAAVNAISTQTGVTATFNTTIVNLTLTT
ncbi:unnamed protein product [Rotaria sp. Silwood2]|nr:unnamed protein product [Rotaria sp. Silwood2]